MKIKDFIKTENGARYAEALKGCNGNWDCEYWKSEDAYKQEMADNGCYTEDEMEEQLSYIRATAYKAGKDDVDFVEVID